jgi:hypothetical protein
MDSDPDKDSSFFNDDEEPPSSQGQDLPKVFHSMYEERPFRCCTSCGESLEDLEESYQVTKTFHGSEVILEYAVCNPCQQNMLKELSKESVATLTRFQHERSLAPANDAQLERYQCEFCLSNRDEAIGKNQYFSIAALCFGIQLIDRPLMVCEPCMFEINEQMSEQTRGRWRDFVDTHFPGVPADSLPSPTSMPAL